MGHEEQDGLSPADHPAATNVTVTDTGDATASSAGAAITGYQGTAPRGENTTRAPVRVSRTGTAVATSGGIANSGYIGSLTVRPTPREPAPWPHQVGVLPPTARALQQRPSADSLRQAFEDPRSAISTQVLTGLGGVGKTQLAAEYARAAWRDTRPEHGLDVLVWVAAGSRQSILDAYAQAGAELCRADPVDPEAAAKTFLAWLEPKPRSRVCRWLVVLDGLDDPEDLRGLRVPDHPFGRTVVTTRRRDAALAGGGSRTLEVGLFSAEEALSYLKASLAGYGRQESDRQLGALALDLGRLPLALAQAVAYLVDADETVADYRRLFTDRSVTLAETAPDVLPDDQSLPLAAAWSLSVERSDALQPAGLARPVLHLASLLDSSGIPQTVLTSKPALEYFRAQQVPGGAQPVPRVLFLEQDVLRALRVLHRLNLLDHSPRDPHLAVRVHQLVQRATRDTLRPNQLARTARAVADALTDVWPDVERDSALAAALRANAASLASRAEDPLCGSGGIHPVLLRLGDSLGRSGQVAAAADHCRRVTERAVQGLGSVHPDVLSVRHALAFWQGRSEGAVGAVRATEAVLADRVRTLGCDHPDTLTTRAVLVRWKGEAGNTAGAIQEAEAVLAARLRILGPGHPDTLETRQDLAQWRGEAGDVAGAVTAYAALVPDRNRALGEEHPDVLATRSNLAFWQGRAGDPSGAADTFAALLADYLRILGPRHPHTLSTRHNHARWRGAAGDPSGAADAFAGLLSDLLEILGADNLETLAARNNLAYWLGAAGDIEAAAVETETLLLDYLRVVGPDHPHTLTTRHNLARWQGELGDPQGAVTAYESLLRDRVRVQGPEHPATLLTRRNLARWKGEAGDPVAAASALTAVLADQVRVLGADHPDIGTTREYLTSWTSRGWLVNGGPDDHGDADARND
ncbi:tetratricopeptide repeat protein [Streptomyces olivaceus]|uniref:tetratricopeptide repeat protein n=1 Tax=Streptomyces olivaceus TaxID=47716 RepID=UPI0033B01FD0